MEVTQQMNGSKCLSYKYKMCMLLQKRKIHLYYSDNLKYPVKEILDFGVFTTLTDEA